MHRRWDANRLSVMMSLILVGIVVGEPVSGLPVEMVGQWGGRCRAVALSGNVLCVGKGQKLLVFDVSGQNPALVGQTPYLQGVVEAISPMGDYAYLACSKDDGGGLQQVRILDPAHPTPTTYQNMSRPGLDVVCANGNLIYVAFGGTSIPSFAVFRVSAAGTFQSVGYQSTFNDPTLSLTVVGNRVYVTNQIQSVGVYNIPDLQASSLTINGLGRWTNSFTSPSGITVDEPFAYVADGPSGIRTVDASVLSNPRPVSAYSTGGDAQRLIKTGHQIYVANGDSGVQLVDASNPVALSKIAEYQPGGFVGGLALSGSTVYAAGSKPGLSSIDFSNPTGPVRTASLLECGEANDVSLVGHYALAASGKGGVQVIDVADPTRMTQAGAVDTDGSANGICSAGNYAYVTDGDRGLKVLDVTVPTDPVQVGACDTDYTAKDVVVSGENAFVSYEGWWYSNGNYYYDHGFTALDVSNPANPERITNYPFYYRVRCLACSGNYLYVGVDNAGLYVFDVSSPQNPIQKAHYSTGSGVFGIAISGNLAYLAAGSSGLQILDISNPSSPTPVGSYQPGSIDAKGIYLSGNLAYVADALPYSENLRIIDVTDPHQPIAAGSANGLQTPSRIALYGDYAIIANKAAGLTAFHVGSYPPPSVSAAAPATGPNTGVNHVTSLVGTGFRVGATVRLERPSQSDIQACDVGVLSDARISCDLDLTGKATGLWSVIVTNTDGQSGTLANGFGVTLSDGSPVCGASNRAAADQIMASASTMRQFRFWGRVTTIDASSFWLDDGSMLPLNVFSPGHVSLSDGDYATAVGTLDLSASPQPVLISPNGVRRISP